LICSLEKYREAHVNLKNGACSDLLMTVVVA
jgi:hypothetical protein